MISPQRWISIRLVSVTTACVVLVSIVSGVSQAVQSQGTILGHVYSAETRMPIAGATVVLQDSQTHKDTTTQTSKDGSYMIRDISRGSYFLAAYADKFLGQYQGDKLESPQAVWNLIAVGVPVSQRPGIAIGLVPGVLDFFLHQEAEVTVTAINDEPLAKAMGERLRNTQVEAGRISPDGTLVALATSNGDYERQVWLYDIRQGRLRSVSDLTKEPIKMAWTEDGTLYVQRESFERIRNPNQPPPVRLRAVTATDIRDVRELPAAITKTFEEERRDPPTTETVAGLANLFYEENDRYRVTRATAHGNSPYVIIEGKNDASRPRQIALDYFSYIFDKDSSEIIYQKSSRVYELSVITILQLQTGRSRDFFLRMWRPLLLDRSRDASLVVVSVRGECMQDEIAKPQFLHPERFKPEDPIHPTPRYHICLIRLPNAGK